MTSTGPIVVGVDGSEVSERALLWAATRAAQAQTVLRVVLARVHPVPVTVVAPAPVWPWPVVHQRNDSEVKATAELLEQAVRATLPGDVTPTLKFDVVDGDAASGLIEVARANDASLLVVGRRGLGGFKRLLLGSVSDECATYAPCSVAVISKPEAWEPQPVGIVGVDGSDSSKLAIQWAAEWARANDAGIDLVHVWEELTAPNDSLAAAFPWLKDDEDGMKALAEETLASALTYAVVNFPDVQWNADAMEGYPSEVLTKTARQRRAAVLVLGTRGLGGFSQMLIGSSAHQCLHQAAYPVVVVRPKADG